MRRLWKYLVYLWRSKSIYRIHSPFLFSFVHEVLNDKRSFYAFGDIKKIRHKLLDDRTLYTITDYGAGSRHHKTENRELREIVKTAAVTPEYGQLLFRIVNHYRFQNILEIGTSVGMGTMYLVAANTRARVITLEGDPALAALARQGFDKVRLNNIEIIQGEFSDTLPMALSRFERLDMAFIDGNHRKAPTLQYFEQILPKLHEHSIVVVDDIYWSEEMEEAWRSLSGHPRVTLAIDIYRLGLLFFNTRVQKEDYQVWF